MPVVGDYAHEKLVDLHTRVFLDRADEAHREERRAHLEGVFDATMDASLAALGEGYPGVEDGPVPDEPA